MLTHHLLKFCGFIFSDHCFPVKVKHNMSYQIARLSGISEYQKLNSRRKARLETKLLFRKQKAYDPEIGVCVCVCSGERWKL